MITISRTKSVATAFAVAAFAILGQTSAVLGQGTVGAWNFTATSPQIQDGLPGNVNTITATSGLGTGMALNMTNTYTYAGGETGPSIVACDIANPGGAAAPNELGWRIRGNSNNPGPGANGWNTAAPEYSQGAQFLVPTAGYGQLSVSFDWFVTGQGVKDMQPQYSIDGVNWINVTNVAQASGLTNTNGQLTAPSSNWYLGSSFSLSGSAALAAANDPNFGIRLVSAYHGTTGTYSGGSGVYNNSSGNWSLNNIDVTGSPILSPLTTGTAPSTSNTWTAASGGTWDTTSANAVNWSSNPAPYADGQGVFFPDLGFSGTTSVTIPAGGVNPGAITISNSTGTYLFSGSPIGGCTGLGGTVSLGIADTGTGTVILASSNMFTGGVAVTGGGTLIVQGGDNRLGAPSGEIFLGNGSTLQTSAMGLSSSRSIIIGPGGGTFNTSGQTSSTSGPVVINGPFALSGSGNLVLTGNIVTTTSAAGTTPIYISQGTTLTVGGAAGTEQNFLQSGGTIDGNLVVNSGIRLDFSNSTYSGLGAVQLTYPGNVVGTGSGGANSWSVLANAGTSNGVTSGGTLATPVQLNPNNLPHTVALVTSSSFSLSSGTSTFIVGIGANKPASNTFAVTGNISGNSDVVLGANDAFGDGNGRLLLSGSNTYSGTTLIAGKGIVALGSSTALPASTDVVFNFPFTGSGNPVLDLGGNSATINSLSSLPSGPGTTFAITNSGSVGATLTVAGSNAPAYPFTGLLQDGPSATFALWKQGAGTLGLSGSNSYSGGTTIAHGVIQLSNTATDSNGSGLGIGPVLVNNGGILAGSTSGGGVTGLVTVQSGGQIWPGGPTGGANLNLLGGLTLNANASLSYYFGTTSASRGEVTGGSAGSVGTLTLPLSGHVTINVNDQDTIHSGVIPLFTFGGFTNLTFSTSNLTNFTLGSMNTANSSGYTFVLDSSIPYGQGNSGNPDQIDLYNPSVPFAAIVAWNTSSGTWNTTAGNWINGIPAPNLYKDGDTATFPDHNPPGSSTVTISGSGVTPGGVIFSNTATAYTLTGGPILGSTGLTASGAGLVTLAATNSYTGGTVITGGTLVAASGDAGLGAPTGPVTLDNLATLRTGTNGLTSGRSFFVGSGPNAANGTGGTFDTNGSNSTLSGNLVVGGTGTVQGGTFYKVGAGTLTLSGTTSLTDTQYGYGGALNVQAGNLNITGALNMGQNGTFNIAPSATVTLASTNSEFNNPNGGILNGTMIIASSMRVNFSSILPAFSGSGNILVPAANVIISNASDLSNGGGQIGSQTDIATYGKTVNILLNSNTQAFTPTDVTQATINTSGTSSFITTIGGTKANTNQNTPASLIINGVISGNSDVNFSNSNGGGGSGSITLNNQNKWTGTSMIDYTGNPNGNVPGGVVILGASNALPPGTNLIFGAFKGNGGILNLNGFNQQVASLSEPSSGTAEIYNDSNVAVATLTVSGATTPYYGFAGIIADNGGAQPGTLALVKGGPNTLLLSGPNGYSAGTTIQGGVLLLSNSNFAESPAGEGNVNVTAGTLGGIASVGISGEPHLQPQGGNLTVYAGAAVSPGLAGQLGSLMVQGNATLNAGASADFGFGSGSADALVANDTGAGVLSLPSTGSVTINLTCVGGVNGNSVVPLFTFNGLTGGTGSLAFGNLPSGANYGLTSDNEDIFLTVNPTATATVNLTGGTVSWGTVLATSPSTAVTLNSPSAASVITLDGNRSVGALILNATNGITIAQGSSGKFMLGSSASAVPPTIQVDTGNSAISAPIHLESNLTVSMSSGTTLQLANVHEDVVGSSLTLTGNGELILSGSGLYTGGTVVKGGVLLVTSNIGLSAGSSLIVGANAASQFGSGPTAGPVTPSADVVAVPEPGTLALLAVGGLLFGLRVLNFRKRLGFGWK
jgi:fibronectin-binding autotransporter adhesin